MNWSIKRRVDDTLLVTVVALTLAGILLVFSASWPVASQPRPDGTAGNAYQFLVSQTMFAVIGGILCIAFAYVSPKWIHKAALPLYLFSLLLMVLCFFDLGIVKGVTMGGARSWLKIGPQLFQPSELAKLALVLVLARCVGATRQWPKQQGETFVACMGLTLPVCGLCILQPDLGTAVVAFCFGLIALFFAGINKYYLWMTTACAGAAGLFLAWVEPYRWERIMAFLHPTEDTANSGYQIARMLITVSRGGVFGQGLGLSKEKWIALPARHTDSIFCVVAGELGIIGSAALVVAFFFLARQAVILARSQPDLFSAVLIASLGTSIALQAFINMGVACGALPCTGLTLPFISAGGSSLICTLVAAGMMLSLSRQSSSGEDDKSKCKAA